MKNKFFFSGKKFRVKNLLEIISFNWVNFELTKTKYDALNLDCNSWKTRTWSKSKICKE